MRVRGAASTRPADGSRLARLAVVAALVVGAAILPPGTGGVALAGAEGTAAAGRAPEGASVPAGTRLTDRVVIRWATTARTPRLLAARFAALGSRDRLDAVAMAAGPDVRFVRALGSDGSSGVYQLDAPLGADGRATLAAIAAIPGVATAEPDVWVTADALPDDPYAAQLWGMLGAANGSPYGIDVQPAWATTRGEGVTVAVIDTGILAHPDLAGQTVAGYDMIADALVANDGGGRDANPSDPGDWVTAGEAAAGYFEGCPVDGSSWHGTHVAGTIAGIEGNAAGVFGGAPDAKIQAVRVLGKCGGYLTDISDAIVWAAGGFVPGVPANATPADVLNLSLGGAAACQSYTASAIATARSLGAVVVVAAGNEGYDAANATPANCPGAFVVAATGTTGARASFSNYGAIVDIAGPGVGIWSALNAGTTVPGTMGYASYSGTSMATPHVAATAALLAAAVPGATNDEIEAAIMAGATAFPSACTGCGAGIAHVPGALEELVGPVPTPTPTVAPTATPAPTSTAAPTATPSASPTPTGTPGPTPTAPPPADVTPPVASAPSVEPRTGSRASSTSIPLSVRWTGADEPGGSGIDHFDVARSTDGGTTWTLLSDTATGTSMSAATAASGTVRFRVRAVDVAGNVGGWSTGPRVAPALVQQSSSAVRWSGPWRRVGASAYSGGSARYSTARWAKSTYTFTGRGIALVSTRARTRGRASIYIDGAYAGAVDMGVGLTQYRTVAWRKTWATSGPHSIRVVVVRNGGRPRVDVDAFVVIR